MTISNEKSTLLIFTTRQLDNEPTTLFRKDNCVIYPLGAHLMKFWVIDYYMDNETNRGDTLSKFVAEALLENEKFRKHYMNKLEKHDKKNLNVSYINKKIKEGNKKDLSYAIKTFDKKILSLKDVICKFEDWKNLIKFPGENGRSLEKEQKEIRQIKRANCFAYHTLVKKETNINRAYKFIGALIRDTLQITEQQDVIKQIKLFLHDNDLCESGVRFKKLTKYDERNIKIKDAANLGDDCALETILFWHERQSPVFRILSEFAWEGVKNEDVPGIIVEKIDKIATRQKIYELKEKLLFYFYPLKFMGKKMKLCDELKQNIELTELAGYANDESVKKLWDDIVSYTQNEIDDIEKLRSDFDTLLKEMKGDIYY